MASVSKRQWTCKGGKRSAWEVRYKEGEKHKAKTFADRQEAEAFRDFAERQLIQGLSPSQGAATVQNNQAEA